MAIIIWYSIVSLRDSSLLLEYGCFESPKTVENCHISVQILVNKFFIRYDMEVQIQTNKMQRTMHVSVS